MGEKWLNMELEKLTPHVFLPRILAGRMGPEVAWHVLHLKLSGVHLLLMSQS